MNKSFPGQGKTKQQYNDSAKFAWYGVVGMIDQQHWMLEEIAKVPSLGTYHVTIAIHFLSGYNGRNATSGLVQNLHFLASKNLSS